MKILSILHNWLKLLSRGPLSASPQTHYTCKKHNQDVQNNKPATCSRFDHLNYQWGAPSPIDHMIWVSPYSSPFPLHLTTTFTLGRQEASQGKLQFIHCCLDLWKPVDELMLHWFWTTSIWRENVNTDLLFHHLSLKQMHAKFESVKQRNHKFHH